MRNWYFLITMISFLTGSLFSCKNGTGNTPAETGRFTAAVWNLQALFDGEETGGEYAEYRTASGWTREKYEARLLSMAQAIARMESLADSIMTGNAAANMTNLSAANSSPDFLGLVELENAQVLEDLLKGPLSKNGYNHTFFGNAPGMSLGIGVISRFPLSEAKVHSITMNNETIPRPILEVHLEPGGRPLIFFICHWKSKVGGEDATEPLRRASARIIGRRLEELRNEKPGTPVIIMGDLNENHDEFYRRAGILSALLPDDPEAAKIAGAVDANNNFIILSSEKPPRTEFFSLEFPVLYTPWGNEMPPGSYFYRDNWETIDHILMTAELFDEQGWDFDTCMVLNLPPFTSTKGVPNSYNPRNGLGLSDHLPLMLYLRKL